MRRFLPYLLFFIFILFFSLSFYLQRHFMTNFDENDHLAVAYFMSRGHLLYKGIFSHHFPFPYYWTFLFTPFWRFSSPSQLISIFRLSALVLYLLNFFLVFISFKNLRSQLGFSLWIFCLSFFFTLYHGNLVLSETYAAIFISSLFWLSLPQILHWEKPCRFNLLLIIIFTSAAFWTQPLLVFLFILPLILYPGKIIFTLISLAALNLFVPIYFYLSGQISDFWQQGIWFNFFVYPRFFIDDQTYFSIFSHEFYLFTHFFNSIQISQFILHLSTYILGFYLISRKKFIPVVVFVLFFLSAHVREVKIIPGQLYNFGIYPLLLLGLGSLCILLFVNFSRLTAYLLRFTFILALLSFSISSYPIIQNSLKPGYNFEVFWGYRQRTADIIAKLSRPHEPILVYPHDVDYYPLSQRLAPDRFVYWFPWINFVPGFRQERLFALQKNDIPVIYLGDLSFKGQPNFYQQYFPDLIKNYSPVIRDGRATGIWLENNHLDRLKSL